MPHNKTRHQILDAAEVLFSQNGLHGVSIRDITDKAGVRLAAVNYYFKTKEGLYDEVLYRRVAVLNIDRDKLLMKIDFENTPPKLALKQVIEAFVLPAKMKLSSGDPAWRCYTKLIAGIAVYRIDPTSPQNSTLNQLDQLAIKFINCFKRLSPDRDDYKAHQAFQLMLSSVLYMLTENGRIDHLSGGKYHSDDFDRITDDLITFTTHGLAAFIGCV